MENIKAVVRVRPILCIERKIGDASCVEVHECGKKLDVKILSTKTEVYKCSKCFPKLTSQQVMFDQSGVIDLIDRAIRGSSVNVLTFGEHSSGKTFTLFGPPKNLATSERNLGLIARSIKYLYKKLDDLNVRYILRLSCVKILDEDIFDMFTSPKERLPLKLQKGPSGEINIQNGQYVTCSNVSSACDLLESILDERYSSSCQQKSHCIVEIHTELHVQMDPKVGNEEQTAPKVVKLGKISFVDLASSEYLTKQQAEDGSLIHEDHSLLVLSKTIDGNEKINNDNATVMDSALTTLLCDSIGVPGRSLLIACIYEAKLHVTQTVKTLQFR